MNPNPLGELTIQVPQAVIDPYATVIAIDFASANGSI
jgi:alpha-L-fucosidase